MINNPDIIIITETWCNSNIADSILTINGYFIEPNLRIDRLDTANGIGGGILVYLRTGLKVLCLDNNSDFNQFCQFKLISNNASETLTFTVIYRSPNSSKQNTEKLCDIINSLSGEKNIIIGDFNFPHIDWTHNLADSKGRLFLETIESNFLHQMVDFPTHVRGNILDLVIVNNPADVINLEDVGNISNSDHSTLIIEIMFNNDCCYSNQEVSDWSKANYPGLEQYLKDIDWSSTFSSLNTQQCWNFFKETISQGVELFVPKVRRIDKNKPIWMTKNVLKLIRRKLQLWKAYKNNRTNDNFDKFKVAEKQAKKAVRSAKRSFEKKLSRNGNRKPFDSYVRNKTKARTGIGPLKKTCGTVVSDNKEMATLLNNTFCSVFTTENLNNIPNLDTLPSNSIISDILFTSEEVKTKIDNLKSSNSAGPDNLSSKLLKTFSNVLSEPLAVIFNKSMSSGIVPQDWRDGNIAPIFKKGSKKEPGNYRPISLTSIPCKVMESIIKDQVVDHLVNNSLLNKSQHGFMKHKSCVTNLLEFFEKITLESDNNIPMDIIYLDFSKAFDKVPKHRLIQKLKSHSIKGNVLSWINNWLTGRRQRVIINGEQSTWEPVLSGVPQGSVLGPLAFVIFINDIDTLTKFITIMRKFADDTKLAQCILSEEDRDKLQDCLNLLCEWADIWGMSFNVAKCKILHVGHNNPKYEYFMNGIKLSEVKIEKDIGVKVSHDLKPSIQCLEAAKTANYMLGTISRAFHFRDRHVFLNLYKQYVRCHLEFSVSAWCPWTAVDKDVLERVQRRAVNMISGLSGRNYEDKLKELRLESLEKRRIYIDMLQTFKIIHGFDDVKSDTWFNTVGSGEHRLTRLTADPLNLMPSRFRLELRASFFSQRVVNLWNSLPGEVKNARNPKMFKSIYQRYAGDTV